MPQIIINTEELVHLEREGETFIFRPQAEQSILDLLALRDTIDAHIERIKEQIARAGVELAPNFRGVTGQDLKAIYRVWGEKFTYDLGFKEPLYAQGFLKPSTVYKVDAKKVEEYCEKNGVCPEGIVSKDRTKKLSFVLPKHEKNAALLQPAINVDEGKD